LDKTILGSTHFILNCRSRSRTMWNTTCT